MRACGHVINQNDDNVLEIMFVKFDGI
jgi:hypothetical protein